MGSLFPDAFFNRGLVYDDLKQYDKAIADYSECIRLNDDAESYGKRANCYDKLGNATAAERDRAKAKELRK
jgi:tetratricopeptide (TPR) repeat protein